MSEQNLLRVVESEISWDVHAYLRFCDLPYHSENTKFRVAMGFPTPLLITECEVLSGEGILHSFGEKIGNSTMTSTNIIADLFCATSALQSKKLNPDSSHMALGTRSVFTFFSRLKNFYSQAE